MFDPELYREACQELKAPEDKLEEIIAMTEHTNKKIRRPLRTALICAAAIAMMVVSVAAANPEGIQELFSNIASYVQVDRYRANLTTDSGETFSMLSIPDAALENRDGKAILVINGEDAADITDVLAQDQHYVFEDFSEDTKVTVTVDGTIDKWSIKAAIGVVKEDGTYDEFGSVTSNSEDGDGQVSGVYFFDGPSAQDLDDVETTVGMYVTTTEN